MNRIVSHLLAYMVNAKVIPNEQKYLDFYRYGLEITISTFLNILLVLLIGLLTKHLIEAAVFLLTFIILRMYAGGYHCSTYVKCNLLMCASFTGLIVIYDIMPTEIISIFAAVSLLLFFVTVFAFCPVENVNKPFSSERQRKKLKIVTVVIGVLFSAVGLILIYYKINIGAVILLTQDLVSALIITAIIGKGGIVHENKG